MTKHNASAPAVKTKTAAVKPQSSADAAPAAAVPDLPQALKSDAPPILKFFPYSTVVIISILVVFKYDRIEDMIQIMSEYLEIDRKATIIFIVTAVFIMMVIMQVLWSSFCYFYNQRAAQKDAEKMYTKERNALIAIFNAMEGKLWRDKTRWCSEEPIERWKGVKIDHLTGRVNKIILPENNLGGHIPEEIGDLQCLKEVDFRLNRIRGTLPKSLVTLQRLQGLYLFDNYIEGKIPDALSKLPELSGIYLYNNCFEEVQASVKLFNESVKEGCIVFI